MRNKIHFLTLGCPKNAVDSERLKRRLESIGFGVIGDSEGNSRFPEGAAPRIILINTCGFIEDAKKESIEEILRLADSKLNGTKLFVFGCLAQRYKEELIREIPEIDAIWGVGEEDGIVERLSREFSLSTDSGGHESSPGLPYAYIKTAEGCDRGCSYCVIPSIRGGFRSAPPEEILGEAEALVRAGKKELILISQDLLSYGHDLKGYDLISLIKDIASISGDFWIRLLYLNPSSLTERLIRLVADEGKICRYLDIPFQHSEERILRLMRRPGGRRQHLELIRRIREAVPGVALRSTLMAGFPGETEEEFKALKGFVSEAEFERLGVFKYSREEGTAAARMKGHLSDAVKSRRYDELMRLQAAVSLKKNRELVGASMRALLDEPSLARIYSQAPEIDGVTMLENSGRRQAGGFADIKITGAMDYDLIGVIDDGKEAAG
ncbi:MAG: 30S ribosomal protein S12 methylthiotransferase RimO [Thermodesulfovibrionales bacterium]|nr:30S ribosomal protein S12 methylthiotransferase RimO [Thermodesulfovibrionales bacterium]